jgi:hypothetical protein
MSIKSNIAGTLSDSFQIGKGGPTLKATGAKLSLTNETAIAPVSVGYNPNFLCDIAAAGTPTATPSETGGLIAAGTYYYVVTASRGYGSTVKSAESAGVTISGSTGSVAVSWTPVPGAVSYSVYRTTASGTYGAGTGLGSVSTASLVDTILTPPGSASLTADTQYSPGAVEHKTFYLNGTSARTATPAVEEFIVNTGTNSNQSMVAKQLYATVPSDYSYTSGQLVGYRINVTNSGSSSANGAVQGIIASVTQSGSGSGTGGFAYGGTFVSNVVGGGTGTVSNSAGASVSASNSSAHTITDQYGITASAGNSKSAEFAAAVTNQYGGKFQANDSSEKNSSQQWGVYGYAGRTVSGSVGNQFGAQLIASLAGSAYASQQYGLMASAYSSSSGIIPNQYGAYVQADNAGAGTATNQFGMRVVCNNAGTVTTRYGFYLESSGAGSVGTNYGVYQADTTAINHFGGKMGIRNTDPTAMLDLPAGTATAGTAPLKLATGTALTTPEDGAVEYHDSHLYFTVGSTRHQLDQQGVTPPNTQTGTTYTLALTDRSGIVEMNNGSANVVTIPLNSSVALPIGTTLTIIQYGAGATTATGASGVTVNGTNGGSKATTGQYHGLALYKRATDEWIVVNK